MATSLKKISKIGLTAAIAALVLAGCGNNKGASDSSSKKTLNWMSPASIASLDPSKAVDQVSDQTLYNSNQGLLVLAGENKVAPGIAKSYSVSKDGKTYTFNLRHSKWNNGKPLTAQDFVYGVQRSANPKTASQMGYYLGNIQGYDQVQKNAKLSTLGVKAEGKYKLVVHLVKPQVYFKTLVTLPIFYAQSEAAVKKYGSSYGTSSKKIVSNGPFTVTNWSGSNDKWTLKKNPYYWDANATKLNNINYHVVKDPQTGLNQYQTGKLDELQLSGKQQVKNFKNSNQLIKRSTLSMNYLSLNQKKVPALKNWKIRRALSLAIDRNQLVNDLLGNGSLPAKGFVQQHLASRNGQDFADAAYVPDAVSYNLKKAKQLWSEGLKETGLKQVNVSILNSDDDTNKQLNEFLQSQLQKLPGLKVSNQLLPHTTVTGLTLKSQYQISVSGWNPSITDPISPLQTKLSNNPINTSKWNNRQYDELVNRSKDQDANDPAKRWDDLVKAEKIMMNDQAVIPLYQSSLPEVIKSNIKGIQYFPNGPIWDFSKAYVD
ncbi:peptide ABC transporter substrate-binding protein [Nicoliella spurrieriana]|uniref:Peptide ABC transporter substrate-binding protein n=1 Tax=Nicoliella spurrieriana TaxID=2925830 RepID=A0A976X5T0_9LACO|nr:peptide ABC transporter substrate-binding protein [Nicoliella spurrieriana]UQS87268.1 peptide ABC transporter substrate-binding protein [Nicoliella spurrieriana]